MEEIEGILQHKEIPILESGTCGQIRELNINYYAIRGEQCIKAWQAIYKNSDRTVIVLPEKVNEGVIISKDKKSIKIQNRTLF